MNIGDVIDGKYTVLGRLGRGGMATVYHVTDGTNEFALKICDIDEEEYKKRFKREVRIMRSISSALVIDVLDFNLDSDPMYFTMPLCRSLLNDIISELKRDHPEGIRAFMNACHSIKDVHKSGAIHRDIKPSNFLVAMDGTILTSDLGLAKLVDRDSTVITGSYDPQGTELFMPPEYYEHGGSRDAGTPGDIYQLGKTLYMIVTGDWPKHINKKKLQGGLYYIIKKATNDNPAERFQSVEELMKALENYQRSLDPTLNPKVVFEENLQALRSKDYPSNSAYFASVSPILFSYKDNPRAFFKLFHAISAERFMRLAKEDGQQFTDLLELFEAELEHYLNDSESSYEDADTVANLMEQLFTATADIHLRTTLLRITAIAAYRKNRYHAMNVATSMLEAIKSDEEAQLIAQLLHDQKDWFQPIIANYNKPHKWHYLIQAEIEAWNAEHPPASPAADDTSSWPPVKLRSLVLKVEIR